jgi:hypothetical protein
MPFPGSHREEVSGPLSRSVPPRPAPIATTALRFAVRLGVEGVMEVRFIA